MDHFNRFPSSSSSRPLFPAYDRNYLSRAPNKSSFQHSPYRSGESDLDRPPLHLLRSPYPLPGSSSRDFSRSYDRHAPETPPKFNISNDYNHWTETRLPFESPETDSRRNFEPRRRDHFSDPHSSGSTFKSQLRSEDRSYRDNYFDGKRDTAFEDNFNKHNVPLTKLDVQKSLINSRLNSSGDFSSPFERDGNYLPRNSNNSLNNSGEAQNTKERDETVLMRVKEIQHLQNLLKLSNDLSLIDEISSNSSQHSPAVFDENSTDNKIGKNVSRIDQHQNLYDDLVPPVSKMPLEASMKDAFKCLKSDEELYKNESSNDALYDSSIIKPIGRETNKPLLSSSDFKAFRNDRLVKNDICDKSEDLLCKDILENKQKLLENRISEMLCNVPKISSFMSPVQKNVVCDSRTLSLSNDELFTDSQNAVAIEQFDKNPEFNYLRPISPGVKKQTNLTTASKVLHQSEPVFSTRLSFESKSSTSAVKENDYVNIYSSSEKNTSSDLLYSDLYSGKTERILPPKCDTKVTEDADWSASKTIPFFM